MTCGFILSSIFSSIVVNRRHFLSNLNPEKDFLCQGIFSFFRRKLKNDRFFLVFLSNSEPSELVSDWDSSSTTGGRSDCVEGLELMVAVSPALAKDEALVLALLGKGGLADSTVPTVGVVAFPSSTTAATAALALVLMTVSDTEEVMDGSCIKSSETLAVDAVVVVFEVDGALPVAAATADAAAAAMLEDASWLYDFTIIRPLGPTRPGVIFRAAGSGGVPVAA